MYDNFFEHICTQIGIRLRSMGYRGQYDKPNCVGIVLPQENVGIKDLGDLFANILLSRLDPNDEDDSKILNEAISAFREMRSDNMGLGTVYYFPRAVWNEDFKHFMDDEDEEY